RSCSAARSPRSSRADSIMTRARSRSRPPSRPGFSAAVVRRTTLASSRHVEAFLEMLSAERGAAALTLEAYGRDLADVAGYLATARIPIERAATEDLRRYLATLVKARLSARTAARRLSA